MVCNKSIIKSYEPSKGLWGSEQRCEGCHWIIDCVRSKTAGMRRRRRRRRRKGEEERRGKPTAWFEGRNKRRVG